MPLSKLALTHHLSRCSPRTRRLARTGTGTGTVFGPGSTGSAVAITNPEGETTVRISDGIGRTAMTIDPEGETSIMSYDQIESGGGFQPPLSSVKTLLSKTE